MDGGDDDVDGVDIEGDNVFFLYALPDTPPFTLKVRRVARDILFLAEIGIYFVLDFFFPAFYFCVHSYSSTIS